MLITLTTDFGLKDPFVGVMKGVIAQINPSATVVDLTHGIPPQDVLAAAMILREATKYFPRGTIHVAVVDPGVGSTRRAVLLQSNEAYFVGPDNGIFSFVFEQCQAARIVHLSNSNYYLQPTSATFHGRDVFAPVAAYLSLGVAPELFGETLNDYVRISWPSIVRSDHSVAGEIVYIDGFGNLFSNIREQDLAGLNRERAIITIGALTIRGLAPNYAAVEKGQPLALINSWGLVEIAANGDSAARLLHASIGGKIYLSAS